LGCAAQADVHSRGEGDIAAVGQRRDDKSGRISEVFVAIDEARLDLLNSHVVTTRARALEIEERQFGALAAVLLSIPVVSQLTDPLKIMRVGQPNCDQIVDYITSMHLYRNQRTCMRESPHISVRKQKNAQTSRQPNVTDDGALKHNTAHRASYTH